MSVLMTTLLMTMACQTESNLDAISDESNSQWSQESTSSETVDTATTDTAPPPYIYTTKTEDKELSLTPKDVETAMSEGLKAVLSLDPMSLHTTYESFRAETDENCPYYDDEYYETYGYYYWGDTCTTGAGANFDGYAYSYNEDGYTDGYYTYGEYRYFYGTARIIDTDGNSWEGSGYSSYYQQTANPTAYTYWSTYGTFQRTGSFDNSSWVDEGFSYEFYNYIEYYGSYPGTAISMSGNISGLDTVAGTLVLDELFLYSESLGSPCPEEAFGTISVRSNEGEWFEATFDGPAYWGGASFPAACDGCADLYHEGEMVGNVCPDFSVLSGWMVEPW